jgi:hypothetical protein
MKRVAGGLLLALGLSPVVTILVLQHGWQNALTAIAIATALAAVIGLGIKLLVE